MFHISVWGVVLTESLVYVFTNSGIHVSTDDKNIVFRDATNKGG